MIYNRKVFVKKEVLSLRELIEVLREHVSKLSLEDKNIFLEINYKFRRHGSLRKDQKDFVRKIFKLYRDNYPTIEGDV